MKKRFCNLGVLEQVSLVGILEGIVSCYSHMPTQTSQAELSPNQYLL